MPFCPDCGTEVAAGMKFCPNCGAAQPQKAQPRQPQTQPMSQQPQAQAAAPQPAAESRAASRRPSGINLLIALDIVGGAAWAFIGLLALSLPSQRPGGALEFALGALSLVSAFAIFRAETWGWIIGMLTAVVYLAVGVLTLSLVGVPNVLLGLWTLYYLSRPTAKGYLGSLPPPTP